MTQERQTNAGGSVDVLNTLLGSEAGSPLDALRHKRADIARFTQDSYDALLEPTEVGNISAVERDLIALRSALLAPSALLAEHYRARLREQGGTDAQISAVEQFPEGDGLSARERLLIQFTDLLSVDPTAATPDNVAGLLASDFSTRDIVTVAQLISFVSYQARVLAGLRAIKEAL